MNTLDDQANIVVDSANMPNISFVDFYIPNLALLQLLFFWRLKIKIMFTIGFVIYSYLHHSSYMVSTVDILHHPPLCKNLPPKFHLHCFPNILAYVVLFSKLQIPFIYKV